MPADSVRFEPNTPVRLALADPQATEYDEELHQGTFIATDGRIVRLPRPAVILLYQLEPAPGEEIQITRHLKEDWAICRTLPCHASADFIAWRARKCFGVTKGAAINA